jgi:hypothetical protein
MKKLNRKDFIFGDHSKTELVKYPGQIANNSFLCRDLAECVVYLCDKIGTIYIDDCSNCKFYLGPVQTSIFMRNCTDCEVSVAAQQVRISDSKNITAFLFSQTQTTLENVSGLVIGPYNFAYSGSADHFSGQSFNTSHNMGFKVMDFTPSPTSWRIMKDEEFPGSVLKKLDGLELEAVNPIPLPLYFGGMMDFDVFKVRQVSDEEVVENEEGMLSFKINVSMAEAEKRSSIQHIVESTEGQIEALVKSEIKTTDE